MCECVGCTYEGRGPNKRAITIMMGFRFTTSHTRRGSFRAGILRRRTDPRHTRALGSLCAPDETALAIGRWSVILWSGALCATPCRVRIAFKVEWDKKNPIFIEIYFTTRAGGPRSRLLGNRINSPKPSSEAAPRNDFSLFLCRKLPHPTL